MFFLFSRMGNESDSLTTNLLLKGQMMGGTGCHWISEFWVADLGFEIILRGKNKVVCEEQAYVEYYGMSDHPDPVVDVWESKLIRDLWSLIELYGRLNVRQLKPTKGGCIRNSKLLIPLLFKNVHIQFDWPSCLVVFLKQEFPGGIPSVGVDGFSQPQPLVGTNRDFRLKTPKKNMPQSRTEGAFEISNKEIKTPCAQ